MTQPTIKRVDVSLDESIALLRRELKLTFPQTTFSIRRSRGTAYGWLSVTWTDGPTNSRVRLITDSYEGQGFDGMTDCRYTKTHIAADGEGNPVEMHYRIAGINTSRSISPALANRCIAQVAGYFAGVKNIPLAVEKTAREGDGYSLIPAIGNSPIAPDCAELSWYTAIHRASCDSAQWSRRAKA